MSIAKDFHSIKFENKDNTGIMEVAEAVPQWNYREKVLWEYVLQPVNKATY